MIYAVHKDNFFTSVKITNLKTRALCVEADEKDELRHFREQFKIPPNTIYLIGNSLGLCPADADKVANRVINKEWALNHIDSWNIAGWYQLPLRVGEKIGKLIGAGSNETIVSDSTSVNIFKCLGTSIAIQKIRAPERRTIVLERENFPTDLYMAQGLVNLLATDEYKIRYFDDDNQFENVLDDDVVVVLMSHVNYRTGQLHNMKLITNMAHKAGAHIIWDLCHSVGSVPINLTEVNADFAVGCTYKYLNSGPGAPAFIYVNRNHQNVAWQPLTGWFGHEAPFKMSPTYSPAAAINSFLVGTPQILQLSIIECSVEITLMANMLAIRKKSLLLSDLFIKLTDEKCPSLKLVTPFEHDQRGSHLSYQHENAYSISSVMRKRGIYGDFRYPDIIRFAMTPLYTRFVDIWDVIGVICDVVNNATYEGFDENCVT
jgi:kynureninase